MNGAAEGSDFESSDTVRLIVRHRMCAVDSAWMPPEERPSVYERGHSAGMSRTVSVIRTLFFLLIAAPAVASEPVALLTPETQVPPLPTLAAEPTLVAPGLDGSPVEPAISDPASGVATQGISSYWMVSSRYSVQNIHQSARGPWGLFVQEIYCNGTLRNSSIEELSRTLIPGIPVCIFVHGSFVELPNQYVEAAGFYSRVQAQSPGPIQMIFFTWPSDGPYSGCFPVDVAVRGRQADFNGFHLAYLLSNIPESCPVCFVGHSHGSRVILSGMHLAGGGTIEGHSFPYSTGPSRRIRVILAAGAMDHHWLNPGQQYECALNRVECLLNLQNRHDLALAAYPLSHLFARRAVARSGFTQHDARKLGYQSLKLRNCDVTHLVGSKHYWPYYYKQPSIVAAMIPYLHFQ